MDTIEKISKFEAIALFITLTTNEVIFNIPHTLIASVGSSSWINGIYIFILALFFTMIFLNLFKPFKGLDILDISDFLGGRTLKTIIGIIYIIFFITILAFSTRFFSSFLQTIYFEATPLAILLVFFLIAPLLCNLLGFKSISSINLIIMPIALITIIILFIFSINEFEPSRLFPILGNGFDAIFFRGTTNIFAFTCFSFLYFIQPCLKDDKNFKSITWAAVIISWFYLFLSVISLLLTFSFILVSDDMMSLYLLARMLEFGRFFQRVDAIFLFIWVSANLSFLSFTLYFISKIFKKITNIIYEKQIIFFTIPIIFAIALLINDISQIKFFSRVIYKYSTCIIVFIISPLILFLANLKHKRGVKKTK